jgi:hypothetical protein
MRIEGRKGMKAIPASVTRLEICVFYAGCAKTMNQNRIFRIYMRYESFT